MQSGSKRGRTGWSQDLSDSEASTELQGQGPFSLEEPAAPGRLASLPCPWSKYVSTPFQRPPRISQATSPDCWSYESRIVPQLLTFLSTLLLGCRHLLLVNCASVMPRCAQGTSAMRSAFLQQLLHTYPIGSAGKSACRRHRRRRVRPLGREDPLEEMETHPKTLAWEIPWAEEPGGLYGPWGPKESDVTECSHTVCARHCAGCKDSAKNETKSLTSWSLCSKVGDRKGANKDIHVMSRMKSNMKKKKVGKEIKSSGWEKENILEKNLLEEITCEQRPESSELV